MVLPDMFLQLVLQLGASMRTPTLTSLVTVVKGWLFAGRHTLTGVLVAVGGSGPKHHSAYYRLFAAARWSLDALGLALFHLIVPLLEPGAVPLTLDDTLARKRGLKVFGAGMHHDPLASSRKYAVTSWGHSWVVLAVRVQLPCVPGRFFSLPILFRLYLNQKAAARWRVVYRTRPELAVELLERLCESIPERRFHAYADSAYGGGRASWPTCHPIATSPAACLWMLACMRRRPSTAQALVAGRESVESAWPRRNRCSSSNRRAV